MRRNGAMFICNRCRKQVFAERFDDGLFDQKALDGWAIEARNFFGVGGFMPGMLQSVPGNNGALL